MLEQVIRRGTLLSVIVLIVSILGVVAALRIPVQMIPDLEVRTIRVDTGWPGATPQDVEKEILIEQERYLRTLPNLRRMVSTAETGRARIQLEFPFGVDVSDALIRVNNALSQVPAYPENVDQPRLFTSSFSEAAFMHFGLSPLPGNPLGLNVDMLLDFTGYVRAHGTRAGRVAVNIGGGAARDQIHIDPARLAQRGFRCRCATPSVCATATCPPAISMAASGVIWCAPRGVSKRSAARKPDRQPPGRCAGASECVADIRLGISRCSSPGSRERRLNLRCSARPLT